MTPSKKKSEVAPHNPGFDDERLDQLLNSLQPLLTMHASDTEIKALFQETDSVLQRKSWLARWMEKRVGDITTR